jgi:tetraacyldisaccharide 4'-kinase
MPFSTLFGAGVRLRNLLYDAGRLRARRLQGAVVSIGSISAGGAGKTPFVIALGQILRQRGIAFDVLSRGYRRRTKGVLQVDPAGSPAEFGDEPVLIAQQLGVAVIVGESRYEAGQWSEKKFGPRLHLLDDGFQHRRLARDFDIVLVTAADLEDRLLPAGRLREPLTAIRRADAVVIGDDVNSTHLPLHGDQMLWRIRRGIALPECPPDPLAFCAIARPQGFFDQLAKAGSKPVECVSFPDHHRYTSEDVDSLAAAAQRCHAGGFVASEKDRINLGPLAARLQPLAFARVTLEFSDSRHATERMMQKLVHRGKTP